MITLDELFATVFRPWIVLKVVLALAKIVSK
jgi:hypothetical protein